MIYYCAENSDSTEGRGRMVIFAVTNDLDDAVKRVKGHAPMGVGNGDIYVQKPLEDVEKLLVPTDTRKYPALDFGSLFECIYGYRQNWLGKWDYGFKDLRDAPTNDPEYAEYQRLQKKFETLG